MGIRSLVKHRIFPEKHTHTRIETFNAPIWKIPHELVLFIFQQLCFNNDTHEIILVKGGPTPWPLLLSAVCSNWRRMMLDNPTLWSFLSVAFGAAPQKPNGRAIHIFLERSQTTPLIVHMRLPSTLPSRKIIRHPAFQALIRDAPRWKMLRLIGDPRILRKNHSMRVVESLPKLEVLSLENMESPETVSDFQIIPMPNLCRLIVITPRARIALQSNFPWTQLTSMRLHRLHNVPSLVQLCPNLIELGLILSSELGASSYSIRQDLE
ncbi:hypothetical protein BDP27DRAFT_1440688 [Rhodocollybia butyracea]|uniref:F-box domain-containing protein n=1 Tax=Rhodocollybia butyracea TaxID=206335 RepID=A0A9P5P3W4_9AGAR|nr:hypothetical protein BDP27DRAFT_1440688 [Rhodocollybia butyracea]